MYAKQTTVVNDTGIHARPAADFVQQAKKFDCAVTVRNLSAGGEAVNAKSIMRVLSQGFSRGTAIEIAADGEGETEAVDALVSLVEAGFHE